MAASVDHGGLAGAAKNLNNGKEIAMTDNAAGAGALAAASQLLKQYGEDAEVIATLRAAEVAALGDADALAHWDEVISILGAGGPTGIPS